VRISTCSQRKNSRGINQEHLRMILKILWIIPVLLIALKYYFHVLFYVKSPVYVHFIISVHEYSSEVKKKYF
jgi:hypothetical protein